MRCTKFAWTSLTAFMLLGTHAEAAEFSAHFSGFQEIGGLGAGQTGAIFSQGKGTLELDLHRNANRLTFKLTYSGMSSPVTQAHVHFGRVHVAGGIIAFFCSNLPNSPGTPACPQDGGTVTGTITPTSVIGPVPQGIAAGNFDALVAALTSNTAYGNIHTVTQDLGIVDKIRLVLRATLLITANAGSAWSGAPAAAMAVNRSPPWGKRLQSSPPKIGV